MAVLSVSTWRCVWGRKVKRAHATNSNKVPLILQHAIVACDVSENLHRP